MKPISPRIPLPFRRPGQAYVVPFAECRDCHVSHSGCTILWIAEGQRCCDTCDHERPQRSDAGRAA